MPPPVAPTGGPVAKEERESRHAELHGAIHNDLYHAVEELEKLRDSLCGSGKGSESPPDPPTPTPADVYANAPGEIRDLSQRIITLRNEIREMVL